MNSLEMGILVSEWNDILEWFSSISGKLQNVHIDLTIAISLYKSLINYIMDLRNSFHIMKILAWIKLEFKNIKFLL